MIVNKIDFIVDVLQQPAHFQRFFCKHNIIDKRCVAYQSAIFEFEQNAQKIFAVGKVEMEMSARPICSKTPRIRSNRFTLFDRTSC